MDNNLSREVNKKSTKTVKPLRKRKEIKQNQELQQTWPKYQAPNW